MLTQLEAAFNAEHERAYGHRSDGAPVQFVNLRLRAHGLSDRRNGVGQGWPGELPAGPGRLAPGSSREAYFGPAGLLRTPVLRRGDLRGEPRDGPLIVEEYDATTVVPPGCTAQLGEAGDILIDVQAR
jgi:N-methylhydantoinase A